jgi:hypothetical protein
MGSRSDPRMGRLLQTREQGRPQFVFPGDAIRLLTGSIILHFLPAHRKSRINLVPQPRQRRLS